MTLEVAAQLLAQLNVTGRLHETGTAVQWQEIFAVVGRLLAVAKTLIQAERRGAVDAAGGVSGLLVAVTAAAHDAFAVLDWASNSQPTGSSSRGETIRDYFRAS
jgi:hypothetical protein